MTISRRTVLTGIGAAAIAPAMPSIPIAEPLSTWATCSTYHEGSIVMANGCEFMVVSPSQFNDLVRTTLARRAKALQLGMELRNRVEGEA